MRMRSTRLLLAVSCLVSICWIGCDSSSITGQPAIESTIISTDDLPKLAAKRTFESRVSRTDPEALLIDLLSAGIPILRAWQPLDNRCDDPLGGRFTVELIRANSDILDFGFAPGTGRLFCATTLQQFTISD